MLQDFKSMSDHFGTLCIKGLNHVLYFVLFAYSIHAAFQYFSSINLTRLYYKITRFAKILRESLQTFF